MTCCLGPLLLLCAVVHPALALLSDGSSDPIGAVAGQPALLPCDTRPLRPGDKRQMVLIFKDGNTAPIYSWDSRKRQSQKSSVDSSCERCSHESLGSRANFWDLREKLQNDIGDTYLPDSNKRQPLSHIDLMNAYTLKGNNDLATPARQSNIGENFMQLPPTPKNSTLTQYNTGSGRHFWKPTKSGFTLNPVRESDTGDYLCRVDFKSSPTKNSFIQLNVLSPITSVVIRGILTNATSPGAPTQTGRDRWTKGSSLLDLGLPRLMSGAIRYGFSGLKHTDDSSQDAASTKDSTRVWTSSTSGRLVLLGKYRTIGPFPVGHELLLQCEVLHGSPPPTVTWVEGGRALPPSSVTAGGHRSSLGYRVPALSTSDIGRLVTCVAENSPQTPLLYDTVRLDVVVPPTDLHMVVKNDSVADGTIEKVAATGVKNTASDINPGRIVMREGETRSVVCESHGSRPVADILWTRDGQRLDDHLIQTIAEPGEPEGLWTTRSVLQLMASPSLHGATIRCHSSIAASSAGALVRGVEVLVLYSPQVLLSTVGDADNVKENSSVSFRCDVHANPPVSGNVIFFRNDEQLHVVPSRGTSNLSSVIEVHQTGPETSGYYTCSAHNSQGTTISAPLHIRVNYAPRCAQSVHSSYSSRGGERLTLSCSVHAQPRPSSFRWYVVPVDSTSEELVDNTEAQSDSGRSSTLQYSAPGQPPYPALHCYADNDIGPMRKPCVITIVPAAQPESVHSCTVYDSHAHSNGTVTIDCQPGKDGGLNQSFTLGVLPTTNPAARPPKALYFSAIPHFEITGLLSREEYSLTITATNARGLSPSYTITYTTPGAEEIALSTIILPTDMTPFLAILFIITILFATCVAGVLKIYKDTRAKSPQKVLVAPCNAEYTRLNRYRHPSIVHAEGGKNSLLHLCGVRGGVACGTYSAGSVDGSSFGGDSLSRGSCRSTTETVLWAYASDSDSQQTFRNSGCYHIDNLTPPEPVTASASPSSEIYIERESLEGSNPELRLLNNTGCPITCRSCHQLASPRHHYGHRYSDLSPKIIEIASNAPKEENRLVTIVRKTTEDCSGDSLHTNTLIFPSEQSTNEEHYPSPYELHILDDDFSAISADKNPSRPSSSQSSRPSSGLSTVTVTLNPNYVPQDTDDDTNV